MKGVRQGDKIEYAFNCKGCKNAQLSISESGIKSYCIPIGKYEEVFFFKDNKLLCKRMEEKQEADHAKP